MRTAVTGTPHHDSALAQAVRTFCLRGYAPPGPGVRASFPSAEVWRRLRAAGTALWLDTGDVDAIRTLWTREFTALTTNNTLLNKEVQKGLYDALVPAAAAVLRKTMPGIDDARLVQEIAFVLNAVHGLKLVAAFDADVSVELHTNLAWDTEASWQYGRRFHAICPDRFIVKVPLTPEGVLAARKLRADGVRINFTLGFSARENLLIARIARPNWVNVFMGRCNAFVADNKLGSGEGIGEKATLASQRMLRAENRAHKTDVRQIGASMRNGQQAFDLTGLDVYTLPTQVAQEYRDLDPAADQVRDRTAADPEVALADGHDLQRERLDRLWAIGDPLRKAVDAIAAAGPDGLTGDDMRRILREHGAGDLFPEMSAADRAAHASDGKIPRYARWKDRVRDGSASWDGLLTEAALASFTADQAKLDERIAKHLK
jgi:transaldolase